MNTTAKTVLRLCADEENFSTKVLIINVYRALITKMWISKTIRNALNPSAYITKDLQKRPNVRIVHYMKFMMILVKLASDQSVKTKKRS